MEVEENVRIRSEKWEVKDGKEICVLFIAEQALALIVVGQVAIASLDFSKFFIFQFIYFFLNFFLVFYF